MNKAKSETGKRDCLQVTKGLTGTNQGSLWMSFWEGHQARSPAWSGMELTKVPRVEHSLWSNGTKWVWQITKRIHFTSLNCMIVLIVWPCIFLMFKVLPPQKFSGMCNKVLRTIVKGRQKGTLVLEHSACISYCVSHDFMMFQTCTLLCVEDLGDV